MIGRPAQEDPAGVNMPDASGSDRRKKGYVVAAARKVLVQLPARNVWAGS